MSITPWKKVGEPETLASGYGKKLNRQRFSDRHGETQEFFFIEGADWNVVLPITKEGKIVMVRQFKQGSNGVMEEIPGGNAKGSETSEAAVRRELKEETGYVPGTIKSLGKFWLNPRSSSTSCEMFLATDCVLSSGQNLDPDEEIEVFLLSPGEYVRKAFSDREEFRTEALAIMRAFPHLGFGAQCQIVWEFVRTMLGAMLDR